MTWRPLCLAAFHRILREWHRRAHSRREITMLDDHAICDLGISRSQMKFEAQKPFWRA
ncbi:MAG: DUF1127 domain-containing protein [Reyranella sp.]|nr:DUF1127 domain-containing protein [Reyranella sp.]